MGPPWPPLFCLRNPENGQELTKPNTPLGVLNLLTPLPFMQTPSTPWRVLACSATLLALPVLLRAVDLDSLVKNSPFGEGKSAALSEKPSNLEFRGMYVDRGVTYFSIYNSTTKLSAWVAQGEAPQGLVPVAVKSYDADNESIVIENAGQPLKLSLKQAVIGTAPAVAPLPAANIVVADPQGQQQPQQNFGGRGFNGGQAPTPEQIQAFRDQMKARMNGGQNGGGATNGEGGTAAPTEGGMSKRDRGGFSRGGDTSGGSNNSSNNGGSRGGKGGK